MGIVGIGIGIGIGGGIGVRVGALGRWCSGLMHTASLFV
jgi:hypothetical protein